MTDRLLPPNASPLEVSVESVAASRIDTLPVPLATVWNPETCPAALLPWLAWALSVDEWDSAWTEAQKRRAIKNSPFIHQHKGTLAAVKRALSNLDTPFTVIEWFEQVPAGQPFTFDVAATLSLNALGADTFRSIMRLINTAKNLRSHYVLRLQTRLDGVTLAGGLPLTGAEQSVYPWHPAPDLPSSAFAGGSLTAGAETPIFYPDPA